MSPLELSVRGGVRAHRRVRGPAGCAPASGATVDDAPRDAPAAGRTGARAGGEPTLDALLSGVWEGLVAHAPVSCPLCGGEMRPSYGSHWLPVGGRCGRCETRIG